MENETVKEQVGNKRDAKGRLLPGNTANPNGRTPNEFSLTIAAKEYLAAHPEDREAIVARVAKDAKNGVPYAAKLYWGYMDGAHAQSIDHTSKGKKLVDENSIVQAIVSALK